MHKIEIYGGYSGKPSTLPGRAVDSGHSGRRRPGKQGWFEFCASFFDCRITPRYHSGIAVDCWIVVCFWGDMESFSKVLFIHDLAKS
jgi:hypothetical protein